MANTKVTGDVIANGTISTVHIADDAITAAKLDSTATGITFADLAVSGNSTLTGNLTVNGAFTSQGIDDNADAIAITINGNEEVGIGTTSPFVKLHVETTASSIARFSYNGSNYQDLTYEGSNIVGGSHVFKIAGSEKMRLDTFGNVGIAATDPVKTLDVRGQLAISNNASSYWYMDRNSSGYFQIIDDFDNPALTIDTSRNVGIGYTSPNAKLEIGSGQAKTVTSGVEWARFGTSNEASNYATLTCEVKGGATAADRKWIFQTIEAGVANAGNIVFQPSGGNVGIGTTSPTNMLSIKGASGSSKGLDIYHSNGNKVAQLIHNGSGDEGMLNLYDSNVETVRIAGENNVSSFINSGSVGIGTTSPESGAKLDVRAGAGGKMVFGSYDANYKVVIEAGDQLNFYNGTSPTIGYINYGQSGTPGSLLLSRNLFVEANSTGGTTGTVRIKSDGKVGIGVTSPLSKFDLRGSAYVTGYTVGFDTSPQGNYAYRLTNDGANSFINVLGGNLGIGTTSPGYTFTVAKSITNDWVGLINNTYNGAGNGLLIDAGDGSSGEILRLRDRNGNSKVSFLSNGNVGIGTTSAISTYGLLHVKGSNKGITIARGDGAVYRSMYIGNGTSNLYFWNGSNEGFLSSAGAWTDASDERIKKNIVDIKYGLQEVLNSKPRSYQMKEDNLEQIGFIAQEMKEIIPEVVLGDEERQLGISYGSLVSVAFKAIQEQQEIINDLKNRIQTLENN